VNNFSDLALQSTSYHGASSVEGCDKGSDAGEVDSECPPHVETSFTSPVTSFGMVQKWNRCRFLLCGTCSRHFAAGFRTEEASVDSYLLCKCIEIGPTYSR